MDVRLLLTGVLGLVLGGLLIVAPEVVLRAHAAGRVPTDRRGEYGTEGSAPQRIRRLVQLAGVVVLLLGLYFGTTAIT